MAYRAHFLDQGRDATPREWRAYRAGMEALVAERERKTPAADAEKVAKRAFVGELGRAPRDERPLLEAFGVALAAEARERQREQERARDRGKDRGRSR